MVTPGNHIYYQIIPSQVKVCVCVGDKIMAPHTHTHHQNGVDKKPYKKKPLSSFQRLKKKSSLI